MEDALRIIEQLEPEQIVERAKSLQLEVDYWRQVLDDCSAVNEQLCAATVATLESTSAALTLLPLTQPAALPLIESIVEQQRVAVNALKQIAATLDGTLDLANGRMRALEPVSDALCRAAGVDPADSGGDGGDGGDAA